MSEILICAFLVAVVLHFLFAPFLSPITSEEGTAAVGDDRGSELREEMELDRATGKLSDKDYSELITKPHLQ